MANGNHNIRTQLFLFIAVCSTVLGNLLLRTGVRDHAFLNPFIALGVLLLILAAASQLALLSWADLSYVNPVTAAGYVLTALAGWVFLHETLTVPRLSAVVLIASGVILVSRTPPRAAGSNGGL